MEVICLEDEAFYQLIEKVVDRIREKHQVTEDKWITGDQAMQLLNISSRTTLQKMRDEGLIRFTQPTRKLIMYDRESILEFLDSKAKETF